MTRRAFAVLAAAGLLAACASKPATTVPALEFTVASYNLRLNLASDGPDAWPHRKDAVKALIQRHGFEVFGTQEGLAEQIDELAAMPGFAVVGVGRDDGRRAGEFAAIFYRTDRFDRLAAGDFWLSETPDRPSKGWDARCCNRLATWVHLRDRASARDFYLFSAHFDHEGTVARRESARLMLRKMREIAGNAPLLCVGDFNATPGSEPIGILTAEMRDARRASLLPPLGPEGTFNGFKPDAPPRDRIDYILLGPGWHALRYAAIDDLHRGRYPSDHFAVVARVRLD